MTKEEQEAADAEAAAKLKAEESTSTLTDDLVKSIADTQERTAAALEKLATPVTPAPDITPDQQYAKDLEAYNVRRVAARAKFKDLAAAGDYDKGMEAMEEVYGSAPQPPQQDPTKTPYYASLSEAALARAKDSDDVIAQWGDEVRAEVGELEPEKRITDAGIKEAVSRVKARHVNEILEASREKIKAELMSNPSMMQNAPTGGGDDDATENHGLDHDQRMVAQALGSTNEEYSDMDKLPMNRDGSNQILPDLKTGREIKPGAF